MLINPRLKKWDKRVLEAFSETRDRVKDEEDSPKPNQKTGNGSQTFAFLMSRVELESEHRKEDLRLKAE